MTLRLPASAAIVCGAVGAFSAILACGPSGRGMARSPVVAHPASRSEAALVLAADVIVADAPLAPPPPPSTSPPPSPSPPLPDLPRSKLALRTVTFVPPAKDPPAPCAVNEGWNGRACVELACPKGASFVTGSGCVRCIGECRLLEKDPERIPWSNVTARFDRTAAEDAVRGVDVSECRDEGVSAEGSHIDVTFRPFGDVYRVELLGPSTPAVDACLRKAFASLRIAGFGGGVETVRRAPRGPRPRSPD